MEKSDQNCLEALLVYIQTDGRVCPMPHPWGALWQMLPGRQRQGSSWNPQPPLILGAWWVSSASAKQIRLIEHLRYAVAHNALPQIDEYLRNLPSNQWAYGDGIEGLTEYRHRVLVTNPEDVSHAKKS